MPKSSRRIAVAALALVASAAATPAHAATLAPAAASDYRDSVGVQMHTGFTGYPYDTEPAATLGAGLQAVGIRHVRDSVCLNTEQACAKVRAKLAALRGAMGPGQPEVDLLLNYTQELVARPNRADRDADIERGLTAAASAPLAGMVAGIEPVNEPDLKAPAEWQAKTLADDATATRLLAEPRFAALRGVPRLSPSIGHVQNTPSLFASGWSGSRADVGNFHPYPPAWGGPENALTTACGTTTALACGRSLGSAAAPIATESGYTTAGGMFSTSWVSERAQAVYLPRLLLNNFAAGVARTYLYELVDLQPDRSSTTNGYGLWHSRRVGNVVRVADAKPAAYALARLHARIGDLGAARRSDPLDLSVTDAAGRTLGDDTIRKVLLERADGSYALALWQPKAVFDNKIMAQRDKAVADLPVRVSLGTTVDGGWAATAFRPTLTGDATSRARGVRDFTAAVGADVTLVDLRSATQPESTIPGS